MKAKNRILIYFFILTGIGSLITSSCEKDKSYSKKSPIITWENPADISFGTLLSEVQLNATANVAGDFVYIPPIGTKLDEGTNQDLRVEFKPADSLTYNDASKTIKINVTAPITVTDIDGNVYQAVTIGTQVWMVENLKTTKYNDGETIPNVIGALEWSNLTTPAYCWYNNNVSNKARYGALYNWYAVSTGKLCPTGWHVPTDSEWTTMENFLIANGYNYDGTTTGDRNSNNKIAKALASATGWTYCNDEGTVGNTDYPDKRNATGFTALAAGLRFDLAMFDYAGELSYWWIAPEGNITVWRRGMSRIHVDLLSNYSNSKYGYSVRCVRD